MINGCVVRKNQYHDSVFLMRVASRISEQKGVLQAAALMGTERNKVLLEEIGIGGREIDAATPSDLIIAVQAEDGETLAAILGNIEGWLGTSPDQPGTLPIRTLEEALGSQPHSNLAVISVPGEYAGREARRALEQGLNVFLFSDNVAVQDERSLKEFAREKGLIVMGPDCGTAIIGGKGIGFANAVRRGSIGVIGASGTGIQEFTSLVHRAGSGISQAIGTGSRDLSDEVGGISFLSALESLEADPRTKAVAILSKPPGKQTFHRVLAGIRACSMPVAACFLGAAKSYEKENQTFRRCRTLDEAAEAAVQLAAGGEKHSIPDMTVDFRTLIEKQKVNMNPGQKFLRGIFAGGTFCYQTQQVLQDAGIQVYSNSPLEGNQKLPDPLLSQEHTLVDMGADEFTSGRPHPMIDSSQRRERIFAEGRDPEVAVLLLDFILGFNASADPAGELIPAITRAKEEVRKRGGFLCVVASVCGTDEDFQDFAKQVKMLEGAGAAVFPSNAQSAEFCAALIRSLQGGPDGRQSQ